MKQAFTLIELLVVVLIIGILAAVALPQYTKAVKKSRVAEAKIALNALGHAGEIAVLADPDYTGDSSVLDVKVQDSDYWDYANNECCHENGHSGCSWSAENDEVIILWQDEGYHLACGSDEYYRLSCANVQSDNNACAEYGFTKNVDEITWIEP